MQARYIRGSFGNKPFTLGKYESTRTRVAISELAANCGAPMGFYTRFKDPEAAPRSRYYQFLKRHDDLFRWHQPHHETLLLFPRRAIHNGDVRSLARFREIGGRMLDEHVLFDIRPDDAVTPEITGHYRQIISVEAETPLPPRIGSYNFTNMPKTVRASLSKHPQRNEFALHLVNYNRIEPAEKHSARPRHSRREADLRRSHPRQSECAERHRRPFCGIPHAGKR